MAVSFFPSSVLHYNNSEFKRNTNCRVKALNLLFPSNGTETIHVLSKSTQALRFGFNFEVSFNSHGRMSSDNHRKSFTPELVQSIAAKVIVVCRQTITAKVSHQNWCKVSQQKSCLYVVRQSPQKFHTRTGAKFHSKSHGRMSSDNHRKSFTPELVQSFTAKVMVVCR